MKGNIWAPLVIIVVVAGVALGATLAAGNSPQLGLDLQGGISVVLAPKVGGIQYARRAGSRTCMAFWPDSMPAYDLWPNNHPCAQSDSRVVRVTALAPVAGTVSLRPAAVTFTALSVTESRRTKDLGPCT